MAKRIRKFNVKVSVTAAFLSRRFGSGSFRLGGAEMQTIVQPAAGRWHDVRLRLRPAAGALTALGVVYGDIGTSALYGFKQAADAAGPISPQTTMGTVSVIFW